MHRVVIVGAKRTPIGSFGGMFKDYSACDLAVTASKAVLAQAGIQAEQVDELILGNVLSAGLGQNLARQVAIKTGLPVETPAFSINKVCGSGLKSVALAAQAIALGDHEIVLCGGAENMSQSPYVLKKGRYGARMGHTELQDSLIADALTDAFGEIHMGITAENLVDRYQLSREAQDAYAAQSQQRAEAAIKAGAFQDEICPVSLPQRKGDPVECSADEYPRAGVTAESLSRLRPAFKRDGSVTAANSSGINDGAAMLLLMQEAKAKALGITPLATITSYAAAGVAPDVMGLGPVPASQKALAKAQLTVKDLDLIEANEAFAAQALSVMEELQLDPERVNVHGGAIALGHPVGASGARILVTLLYAMEKRQAKRGLATLCIGGGMGQSVIVERD